jgi:hypothetical protein
MATLTIPRRLERRRRARHSNLAADPAASQALPLAKWIPCGQSRAGLGDKEPGIS